MNGCKENKFSGQFPELRAFDEIYPKSNKNSGYFFPITRKAA
jgi:hypothetical protein